MWGFESLLFRQFLVTNLEAVGMNKHRGRGYEAVSGASVEGSVIHDAARCQARKLVRDRRKSLIQPSDRLKQGWCER